MNATQEVYQSKWGFHPCSKELSKKLRTINRVYEKALRQEAAWHRWNNKQTNTQGEPEQCPIFEWTFKWPGPGRRPYRISKVGEAIREASRQARKPVATLEEVKRLAFGYGDGSEEAVLRLYELCAIWEG